MKLKLLILLLLGLNILGCRAGTDKDVQSVKGTIMRYNQLLALGYAKMNMNPLQEVATADQATKEYYHMAALGEARVRMQTELKNIEFVGVKFPNRNRASVITREVWDFRHIDIKTQKPVYAEKGLVYNLQYELEKHDGKWLVTSITAIEDGDKGLNKAIR